MTKKIIAFGASSSKYSINQKLANFAANAISNANVKLLDLNDFEMPIFSIDRELESGIPELAYEFKKQVKNVDGIVISFAEHNGAYSAAFKNIFDWISRIENDVWLNKPMFLLATSPGKNGGKSVLDIAVTKFRRMNANTIVSFSLPSFSNNFSEKDGITDKTLLHMFNKQLALFELTL
ncbi:NADPH-dependent FMN reductase [Candidatus Neomarinimicrobiota bacterium]